jgi:hypothetical protein
MPANSMAVATFVYFNFRIKSNFLDFCSFGRSSLLQQDLSGLHYPVDILTGYLFGFFGFLMFKVYKIAQKKVLSFIKLWVHIGNYLSFSGCTFHAKKSVGFSFPSSWELSFQ